MYIMNLITTGTRLSLYVIPNFKTYMKYTSTCTSDHYDELSQACTFRRKSGCGGSAVHFTLASSKQIDVIYGVTHPRREHFFESRRSELS